MSVSSMFDSLSRSVSSISVGSFAQLIIYYFIEVCRFPRTNVGGHRPYPCKHPIKVKPDHHVCRHVWSRVWISYKILKIKPRHFLSRKNVLLHGSTLKLKVIHFTPPPTCHLKVLPLNRISSSSFCKHFKEMFVGNIIEDSGLVLWCWWVEGSNIFNLTPQMSIQLDIKYNNSVTTCGWVWITLIPSQGIITFRYCYSFE